MIKNKTSGNTDNKGKLFVTVFAFVPATKTDFQYSYRDRTSAHLKHPAPGLLRRQLATLYRDTRITQLASTMTAKTRTIPSLHRDSFAAKVPGPYPVLASGNTTSPYCRAVIRN